MDRSDDDEGGEEEAKKTLIWSRINGGEELESVLAVMIACLNLLMLRFSAIVFAHV